MAQPSMPPNEEPDVSATVDGERSLATLALPTAGDVEQLVRAHGTTFLVTNRRGDIAPAGARELGFFSQDTRHLSHLELTISGAELVHLSSSSRGDAYNQIDLMASGLEPGDVLDDPQNYLHVRRRQLVDEELVETIELTSFLRQRTIVRPCIALAADFVHMFEVRGARRPVRGVLNAPRVTDDTIELSYRGLDGKTYKTRIELSPRPIAIQPTGARFELSVEPGETVTVFVRVRPSRSGGRVTRGAPFEERAARLRAEAEAIRSRSARFVCDNATIQLVLDQSAMDLAALRTRIGPHEIVAAGIPWFCCPFGRDALIASYSALLLDPELAIESLRALASYQGKTFDPETEEEPGKIFHELRFGEMVETREIPHRPYYGAIDATPLFVIVADAAYKITADRAFLEDMRGPVLRALEWIDQRTEEGKQFLTYQRQSPRGLDNQGWKDSRSGVSFPDGRVAEPPIAVVEVQGYCVDAYERGARLLSHLGEHELASRYRARGERMREKIEAELWLEKEGRYAFAIDGHGAKLPTIVSNVGHLLWSRVPRPERAMATAELLFDPRSFSGYGIRTLATGQPVYNPLSYHNGTVWPHDNALIAKGMANYRLTSHATRIFEGLVAAMASLRDHRLPELFCGHRLEGGEVVQYPVACRPQAWAAAAPFLLTQAVLGIHADGPGGRLAIRNPSMPPSMKRISLEGLRVGASRVDVRFRQVGKQVHVERLDVRGPPIRTDIELD
jgi:glycogen debranching enzyme